MVRPPVYRTSRLFDSGAGPGSATGLRLGPAARHSADCRVDCMGTRRSLRKERDHERMFAFSWRTRYGWLMENVLDFRLATVANACIGAAALRGRLAAHGFDTATVARLVHTSPLTLARAIKTRATPRGLLIGLAVLTAVMDRLATYGVGANGLTRDTETVDQAIASVAAESPVAADMLTRLCELQIQAMPVQLSFDSRERTAA